MFLHARRIEETCRKTRHCPLTIALSVVKAGTKVTEVAVPRSTAIDAMHCHSRLLASWVVGAAGSICYLWTEKVEVIFLSLSVCTKKCMGCIAQPIMTELCSLL